MLSDKFHADTSDRHGSGMPRIRTAESRRFGTKREHIPSHLIRARNVKSFKVGTPEDTAMLSDMFQPDRCDRHSYGMPRIRTADLRRFSMKWEHVPCPFVARNPPWLVLLIILQCYPTSFMRTEATGMVPAGQAQNRAVLARNGSTYPVISYELKT
jgi:hypothetical protein